MRTGRLSPRRDGPPIGGSFRLTSFSYGRRCVSRRRKTQKLIWGKHPIDRTRRYNLLSQHENKNHFLQRANPTYYCSPPVGLIKSSVTISVLSFIGTYSSGSTSSCRTGTSKSLFDLHILDSGRHPRDYHNRWRHHCWGCRAQSRPREWHRCYLRSSDWDNLCG